MRKIAGVGPLGVLALSAILVVVGFHVAMGDYLLFHSDFLSLGVYIGGMALAVTALLAIPSALLFLTPHGLRARLYRLWALGLAVAIVTTFIMVAVAILGSVLEFAPIKRLVRYPFYLLAICGLPGAAAVVLHRKRAALVARVERLGLLSLAAIVVAVGMTAGLGRTNGAGAPGAAIGAGKHLVLLVLDGLPAQYIRAFSPAARPSAWDTVLGPALVFDGMRTTAAWTSAHFGALYTGRLEVVEGGRGAGERYGTFLRRLQREGVAIRWLSYHRSGMPEGSNAHLNDYSGLRSYLLTQNYTWIPEFLGLGYHVALSSPAIAQNLTSDAAKAVFGLLNVRGIRQTENALVDFLLPELKKLRRRSTNSFSMFHIGWDWVGRTDDRDVAGLPHAQEGLDRVSTKQAIAQIRERDYRYDPELEPFAAQKRRMVAIKMAVLGKRLAEFTAALDEDESLRDTSVIITADHGTMYRHGRFWYGFHPSEQVIRVPFAMLNVGRSGTDQRAFSTPDLTRSILDFFGVVGAASGALSMFGDRAHEEVASLTLASDKSNEWFLVILRQGLKYQVNLHPKGRGETAVLEVNGFEETLVDEIIGPPPEISGLIGRYLARFGIDKDRVHPVYR